MHRLGWMVCLALVVACGTAPSPSTTPAERSVDTSVRERTAALDARVLTVSAMHGIKYDDGSTMRGVHEGVRFEVAGGEPRLSETTIVGDVIEFVEARDAWVFLLRDGALLRAPTFLGELERVAPVPPSPFSLAGTHASARLALLAERPEGPTLLVSDGGALVALPPTDPPLRQVVFRSADAGLARRADGSVALTNDGGMSWRAIDLGNVASWIDRVGDHFVADDGHSGAVAISTDGRVTRGASVPRASTPVSLFDAPRAVAGRLMRALRGLGLADERQRSLMNIPFAPPERPSPDLTCTHHSDGPTARLLSCETAGVRGVWIDRGTGSAAIRVPALLPEQISDAWFDAGETAVVGGDCDPSTDELPEETLCVIDVASGAAHGVTLRAGERLVAVRAGALLVGEPESLARTGRIVARDGTDQPLPMERSEIRGLSASGELLIVSTHGRAFVGPLGATLTPVALPAGTSRLAMLDADRGVAAGDALESVHVTSDGGATFHRVAVTVDGRLGPADLGGLAEALQDDTRCGDGACVVRFGEPAVELRITSFSDELRASHVLVGGVSTRFTR